MARLTVLVDFALWVGIYLFSWFSCPTTTAVVVGRGEPLAPADSNFFALNAEGEEGLICDDLFLGGGEQ